MTDIWVYPLGTALGGESVSAEALTTEFGPVREDFLSRTGFRTLYRATPEQTGLSLAQQAIEEQDRAWWADAVDTIIYVTSTGDLVAPGNSHLLQERLGLSGANRLLFDFNDACTGFVKALHIANSLITAGTSKTVLLVLSDTYSKLYAPSNLRVSPLFSDGASATIVSANPLEGATVPGRHWRIMAQHFLSDGAAADQLSISRGEEGLPLGALEMNGGGVLNFVLKHLRGTLTTLAEQSGIETSDVDDWYVHQGSRVVVSAVMKAVSTETELFRSADYGNTVGSSLPFILVDDREKSGEGATIGLLAFGVGLTMAGLIIEQLPADA
ncbi:MAG: hypothetical protein KKH51_05025 [Actinobacteria bacterium]|nr:hypothetical protein [Actinomycetota bacterium]